MKMNLPNILSNKEKQLLKGYCNDMYFEKEELLIKKNSALHSVYFVEKGMIKYKDSNNKLYFIVGENDYVGLSSIFDESKKIYNAYATANSKIIQIDKIIIKNILTSNPFFTEFIIKQIGYKMKFFTEHLNFRNKRVNGAVASFLLMYQEKDCLHDLTRKEIGELIGYSRENISKVFKMLINEEIIKDDGKIEIINKEALENIKKFG